MKTLLAAVCAAVCAAVVAAAPQDERRPVGSREFTFSGSAPEPVASSALWVSRDGGRTWKRAVESGVTEAWGEWADGYIRCTVRVPEDGAYDFFAQLGDALGNRAPDPKPGQAPSHDLRFQIRQQRPSGILEWDEPKGSPEWTAGATVTLRWHAAGAAFRERSAELQYSYNSRAWVPITRGLDPSGSYTWIVPNRDATELRLRIRALTRAGQEAAGVTDPISVRSTSRPDVAQARALYDRARVLAAQQRLPEAALKYEEALVAWPEFSEAMNDLGVLNSQRNEPAKALEYFLRARRAGPSNPNAYVNAAMIEARMGMHEDAMMDLRDALALGVDRDERTAVLAGETLWKIAAALVTADREKAAEACSMIQRIRQASRPTKAKAQLFLESLEPQK